MQIYSKRKENQIFYSYFPLDVSQLNTCGLYTNNIFYMIYKFSMCGAWIIIFSWQLLYWKIKILMYLTTWNMILGMTYNVSCVLELVFYKNLKQYRIWRINHFIFLSHIVVSIVILIFDSSLISRSYLEYTDNPTVSTLLFYSSSLMPTILSLVELVMNNVVVTNYKCCIVYLLIGGPYTLVLSTYSLLVEPVYKQITFKDKNTWIILVQTIIITGMAFMFVRIYCQIFKLNHIFRLLHYLQTKEFAPEDTIVDLKIVEDKRPQSLASQIINLRRKKQPESRDTRAKKMLPSLRKVFLSIIYNES